MSKKTQNGFVLVSALIFLLLMIYLGLAMFRGFGLDEIMAGNLREKSRATEAAQGAIEYAESWIIQSGNATTGVTTCTAGATTPQICTGTPSLTSYSTYAPATMAISISGGVGTYYQSPRYSIFYLGKDALNRQFYTITAQAWGGNQNAVAQLQTVYRVGCKVCDLGGS